MSFSSSTVSVGGVTRQSDYQRVMDNTIYNRDNSVPVPIGAVLAWTVAVAPTNYLLCNGASYLRADYPDLFALIGTDYGSVDGTHFNVPKSDFDSGWVSTASWTAAATITINHGLVATFDNIEGHIFVREDAAPTKIYNVSNSEYYSVGWYGQRLNGIAGDSNNCNLQILATTTTPGRYVNDSGNNGVVPTTGWTYKVVLKRKDFPAGSIIRAL